MKREIVVKLKLVIVLPDGEKLSYRAIKEYAEQLLLENPCQADGFYLADARITKT